MDIDTYFVLAPLAYMGLPCIALFKIQGGRVKVLRSFQYLGIIKRFFCNILQAASTIFCTFRKKIGM
jgi:hypothetical protein